MAKRAERTPADAPASDASPEALLQAGFDLLQTGVAIFDREFRLVARNARFCALRHYPTTFCVPGLPLEALIRHNAERGDYGETDVEAEVKARFAEITRLETRILEQEMPDGTILLVRYDPMPQGGVMLSYSDVTEVRRAERALRASEERHSLVAEAASEGLYDWNVVADTLYASPRLRRMFGLAEGELTAQAWNERVHPDDMKRYRRAIVDLFRRRVDHLHCEYRVRDKDDAYIWLHDSASAVRNEAGRVVRVVGAVADVSERKRMEEAVRDSERRYALAMASVGFGVYDWDIVTDTIEYSPGMYKALQITPDDVQTAGHWAQLIHPDDQERYRQALVDHFKGATERFECEIRYRSASGEWRWAKQHGLALRDANGRAYRMAGSAGDITEEKRLEAALHTARQQLLEAVESISEGFLLTDAEDRIVLCNSKLKEYYSGAVDLLTPGRQFEDLLRLELERDMLASRGVRAEEWIASRLKRRRNPTGPFEHRLADGRWLRISERHTGGGGVVGIYTDISEIKRREEELSTARDRAMEAVRAKNWFLANMSHELRTPLNAIIGITELLEDEARDDDLEDYFEPLQRISRAAKHLLQLISEVLDLSKIEAGRLEFHIEDIDLLALMEELRATAEPLMHKNRNRLSLDCPADIGFMRADLARVRQVLLNLLNNAAKFTENGKVSLGLRRDRVDGGDWIVATVADTGIGMSAEQMVEIFEEFSQADTSTTRKHGGTGLGLSISQRLCAMMGGEISVESEPGQGSVFTVRLPSEVHRIGTGEGL